MPPPRSAIDRVPRRRRPPPCGMPLLLAALLLASACATHEVTPPRDPTLAATVEELPAVALGGAVANAGNEMEDE